MPEFDLDAALEFRPDNTCMRWVVNGVAAVSCRRSRRMERDLDDLVERVSNQPGQRWRSSGLTERDRRGYLLSSVVDWERIDELTVWFRVTVTVLSDEADGTTKEQASDAAYWWWMEKRVGMFGDFQAGFEDMEMTDVTRWPYA